MVKSLGKRGWALTIDSLRSLSLARGSVHLMTLYIQQLKKEKKRQTLPLLAFSTIGPAMHIELQYTQLRKNALN